MGVLKRCYSREVTLSNIPVETIFTFDTFAALNNFSPHSGSFRTNFIGIAKHSL